MAREAKNPVKTTRRSLDIVETLREMDGARLTELADRLDLPNSTVHNHLSTLMEADYVLKDDDVYRVSLRFLDLGEYARNRRKIYELAKPEIEELAAETGEVANLLVEENDWGVYLWSSKGENAVPLDIHPGKHVHLHATSLGKCILAHLSDKRVEAVIERRGLPAQTDSTITDADALADELDAVREQGYAIDDEERLPGMRCIGTAVKSESGNVIGAISVSGPTSAMPMDRLTDTLAEKLLGAANVIELKVAYS
ncbi:IclR family transcriptional regulator [Halorussus amylolyticus]|uniref:IclR family transcriptional regulator n=1 Tax=Halorussus amylolyticus TaxID=1126242 RepID=UPI001050FF78|nr:IclR family transcriptional regulator [Halorussus amylolyticus]